MRIVIMPSSQEHNACRMGDTEQAHTRLIAARTAELLRAAGHDARYVVAGNDNLSDSEQLAQMAAASNALHPDLHVDVHTDAGGATGSTVFYIGSGRSKALGEAVYREISRVVPFPSHGVRERGTLYMLRKTTASAILVECWPHDRYEQAKWGHEHIDTVARAIAAGVLTVAGGTIPAAPAPKPTIPPIQEEDMQLTDIVTRPDGKKATVQDILRFNDQRLERIEQMVDFVRPDGKHGTLEEYLAFNDQRLERIEVAVDAILAALASPQA